ncbi:MAG: glycosyltransferase family 1 protein [Chloroflexi bacterium]|nr:MAG: glycosyltransferase family 1 protein [Chloroflexota bacterium]
MKILYFSRDYTTHDHRFLSALTKAGEKVYYITLERRGHVLEDRALPGEVEIVSWAGGKKPARLVDGPMLLLDLKHLLRKIRPDILHAGPLQTVGFLSALSGFQPFVSMSWGYDLLIDAERSASWRWSTRYTLNHSAAMVGDCETIRQRAASYGMAPERIVTFPWGVDLEKYHPGNRQDAGDKHFTLLSTRSWEPVYGVDVLVRGFLQAAQSCPKLHLVLLGNGSQAPLLRKMIAEGGAAEKVTFAGQISQKDLPRYYRSADLYVSASHSDGTSISLLEAMACGTPVLVSDIPGNKEWVTPGVEGWLFPDGDSRALAGAIISAFERREQLVQMSEAARNLAERRADWEKNFPELLRAYDIARSHIRNR